MVGRPIVLTLDETTTLEEADPLANRVIVINQGQIIAEGPQCTAVSRAAWSTNKLADPGHIAHVHESISELNSFE